MKHLNRRFCSVFEVRNAVIKANIQKVVGVDDMYSEALKSDSAMLCMHSLFNVCFNTSVIFSIWNRCIINPIPKSTCFFTSFYSILLIK